MLGRDFEDEVGQDLCLNLWHDLEKLLWQDELNPRVRCAFGNVYFNEWQGHLLRCPGQLKMSFLRFIKFWGHLLQVLPMAIGGSRNYPAVLSVGGGTEMSLGNIEEGKSAQKEIQIKFLGKSCFSIEQQIAWHSFWKYHFSHKESSFAHNYSWF